MYDMNNAEGQNINFMKAPKLIYKPSRAVMKEQILGSLLIKNVQEFIDENRIIEVKLEL